MANNSEAYYVNLLNIFIKHYNNYGDKSINMFHGIETDENTNDMMEEFFEHITQFKEANEYEKQMLAPDNVVIDDYEQLFELRVDSGSVCFCSVMFPLLDYVAREIDWVQCDWKIIPIKLE